MSVIRSRERLTWLLRKDILKLKKILQCSLSCLHLWWAYIPDKFMSHLCYMESHVAEWQNGLWCVQFQQIGNGLQGNAAETGPLLFWIVPLTIAGCGYFTLFIDNLFSQVMWKHKNRGYMCSYLSPMSPACHRGDSSVSKEAPICPGDFLPPIMAASDSGTKG